MDDVRKEEGDSKANDLFVFAHIPKTAGMTFKTLLGHQFPANQVCKIGPDYQGGVEAIKSLSPAERARIQCVIGHVPFGIHQYFEQRRPQYVSFVRDPVDRALSEYLFFSRRPQLMPLLGLDKSTTLPPRAFWEHQASIGMMDLQTRVLSGYDNMVESVLPPYPKIPAEQADALIRSITDSFSFIGTVKRFDESLLLMKQKFGWRSVYYVSRNVAPKSNEKMELRRSFADELRELNPIDSRLFAHIRDQLEQKILEQGEGFDRRLRRFRRMNRWYAPAWNLYRRTGLRRLRLALTRS